MSNSNHEDAIEYRNYIDSLPDSKKAHINNLQAIIQKNIQPYLQEEINKCLFTFGPHDYFEDAQEVFNDAYLEMCAVNPLAKHEVPLLFLGYHLQLKTRVPQGFFLTDQAIYAQSEASLFKFTKPLPKAYAIPTNHNDIPDTINRIINNFTSWDNWADLLETETESVSSEISILLTNILSELLDYNLQNNNLYDFTQHEINLEQFIKVHDLNDSLLLGKNPLVSKKIGKIIKKFNIPSNEEIVLALVDFPFFGGPWGMTFTNSALYSRDLFETPQRIPFNELNELDLCYTDDKKEMVLNGEHQIFIPSYISQSIQDELLDLLRQEIKKVMK